MADLFAAVDDLQARAKSARSTDDLDTAVALLEQAAASLDSAFAEFDPEASPTEEERRLAAELAETYGLLGGTHRRRNDSTSAVEAYGRGRLFEASDRYKLGSTYASLNWIVESVVADPSALESDEVTAELQRLRRVLVEQQERLETFDPWVAGDLALAKVLTGASDHETWRDLLELAPDYAVDAYAGTVARLADVDTSRRSVLRASLAVLKGAS